MAAPTVRSVTPASGQTGVVLGTQITVQFDQEMDTTSVTPGTFVLTGPGLAQVITPDQLLSNDPSLLTQTVPLPGTFTWAPDGTLLTFNPNDPLQKNQTYRVLVLGGDGEVTSDSVKNLAAEALAASCIWEFTTGDLAINAPPPVSPLPAAVPYIDPGQIRVVPRSNINANLSEIDIIFPGNIDPDSFNISDILLSLEPVLNDPYVTVPNGLTAAAVVDGNTIRITINGWQNGG